MTRIRIALALIATALFAGCSSEIAAPDPAAPALVENLSEVGPSLSETVGSGTSATQDSIPSRMGQPFMGSGN